VTKGTDPSRAKKKERGENSMEGGGVVFLFYLSSKGKGRRKEIDLLKDRGTGISLHQE